MGSNTSSIAQSQTYYVTEDGSVVADPTAVIAKAGSCYTAPATAGGMVEADASPVIAEADTLYGNGPGGKPIKLSSPWVELPCGTQDTYTTWKPVPESGKAWTEPDCKDWCNNRGECAGYAFSSIDGGSATCTSIAMTCKRPNSGVFQGGFKYQGLEAMK